MKGIVDLPSTHQASSDDLNDYTEYFLIASCFAKVFSFFFLVVCRIAVLMVSCLRRKRNVDVGIKSGQQLKHFHVQKESQAIYCATETHW